MRKDIGFSPFYMVHGVEPILPFDVTEAMFLIPKLNKSLSHEDLIGIRARQLEKRQYSLVPDSNPVQSIEDINITVCSNGSSGKATKQVQSVANWTLSFYSTKAAILFLYEECTDELNIYEEFIMSQFTAMKMSEHHHVIKLNKAIQKQVASFNNCTCSTTQLLMQFLNTIGLKSSNSYGLSAAGLSSNK
ncbi:hypothetical protein M422DRAFT_253895 [Sphaerobolus stellatus SS14]|uniref:Uncharacterized protein n=1 Tax=Sphaerobolus stellatus (strain SS14) TaxID=990650 RepID=A0A0C9UIB3_SPHS4|nr:hypothetical protein M422DRAFT_253895 [Sphaerobolus stellatus SS14]